MAFAAGNLFQLVNLATQEQTCFRSLGGGGIGAIAVSHISCDLISSSAGQLSPHCCPCQVHPSHEYFAVGEKGHQPVIAIYTYPQLSLYRILRGVLHALCDKVLPLTALLSCRWYGGAV